eukprot:SAG11_NODE_9125_length_940_cov_1.208086_1_plen_109_part_00
MRYVDKVLLNETARYHAHAVRLFKRAIVSGECNPEIVVELEKKISEVRMPLGELCRQGGDELANILAEDQRLFDGTVAGYDIVEEGGAVETATPQSEIAEVGARPHMI